MLRILGLFLVFLSCGAEAGAQVEIIGNGMKTIDLGKGLHATATLAHRENFNAHSFDVLNIYIKMTGFSGQEELEIIPFYDANKKEAEFLTRAGGADCRLHDFRVLKPEPGKFAQVVAADRERGTSFADPAPVVFTFYRLMKNNDQTPGWPVYYFEAERTQQATDNYCDVGDALQKELRLEGKLAF